MLRTLALVLNCAIDAAIPNSHRCLIQVTWVLEMYFMCLSIRLVLNCKSTQLIIHVIEEAGCFSGECAEKVQYPFKVIFEQYILPNAEETELSAYYYAFTKPLITTASLTARSMYS